MSKRQRPEPPRVAALYCRVSSDAQEANTSLGEQERLCREFAAREGYVIAAVYREVWSGFDLWERPQLTALREAARAGEIDTVICYALDRLSRRQVHTAILADEWERAGVAFVFATERFEQTAVGEFLRSATAFAAELEREKLVERTQRGRRARARAGKLIPGRRVLYGYRYRDETKASYDIDPETGPIVAGIFAEAARGTPTRTIGLELERRAIPSPGGSTRWYHTTIYNILRNPTYTGRAAGFRVQVSKAPGGKALRAERPAEQQIPLPAGVVPPLIDEASFALVQERLKRNKELAARNNRDPEGALLRGLAKCALCGHTLRVKRRPNHPALPDMYACHPARGRVQCGKTMIVAQNLDAAVWERVGWFLQHPDIVRYYTEQLAHDDGLAEDIAGLERLIAEIERKRGNLTRTLALFDSQEDAAPVVAEIGLLGKRGQELSTERAGLLARRERQAASEETLRGIQEWCTIVGENLPQLDFAQRRAVLEDLGITVKVWPTGAACRWVVEGDPALAVVYSTTYDAVHNYSSPLPFRLRWADGDPLLSKDTSEK